MPNELASAGRQIEQRRHPQRRQGEQEAVLRRHLRGQAPDQHADVVELLAKNTALNKPELVKGIAPNWSYINEDGLPLVDSVITMQDFWSGKYFNFVEKKISREQLFDLGVAKEAAARLAKEKPFD